MKIEIIDLPEIVSNMKLSNKYYKNADKEIKTIMNYLKSNNNDIRRSYRYSSIVISFHLGETFYRLLFNDGGHYQFEYTVISRSKESVNLSCANKQLFDILKNLNLNKQNKFKKGQLTFVDLSSIKLINEYR